jgi:diphthamide biosynthesis protein 3
MSFYDEIEIEDMTFDSSLQIYHFPCPCGDRFEICIDDLRNGEDVAVCPSCSLMIKVIFEIVSTSDEGLQADASDNSFSANLCWPIMLTCLTRTTFRSLKLPQLLRLRLQYKHSSFTRLSSSDVLVLALTEAAQVPPKAAC